MRKSILCLLGLLPLGGCGTPAYQGLYRTDCHLTKTELHIRAIKIAQEIFREVGAEPHIEFDSGHVSIQIEVPHKREIGVTVPPRLRYFESDDGLEIQVETYGDGTRPESKKLNEIVQQVLARNNCGSWKFEERTYNAESYL